MRLIDADALMPLFMKKANTMKDRHGVKLGEEWLLNYNDIKDVIDNAPTVERPQGKWIFNTTHWSCSVCNKTVKTIGYCGTKEFMYENFRFCPNCGTDMKGGAE